MSPRGYLAPKGDGQTMIGATVERVGFDAANTLGGLNQIVDAGLEIAPGLVCGRARPITCPSLVHLASCPI